MYRPENEPIPAENTGVKPPDSRVLILQNPDAPPVDKEEAFASIHEEFYQPLVRYTLGKVGSPEKAEEAVQESLMRAWKSIGKFDPYVENASFSGWLYRVTHNTTLNIINRESKHSGNISYEEAFESASVEKSTTENDPVRHVLFKEEATVIKSLSPVVKEALSWDLDEKTYQEIAEQEGLTLSAVKSRLVRARKASKEARSRLDLSEAEKEEKKATRRQKREFKQKEEDGKELAVAA